MPRFLPQEPPLQEATAPEVAEALEAVQVATDSGTGSPDEGPEGTKEAVAAPEANYEAPGADRNATAPGGLKLQGQFEKPRLSKTWMPRMVIG